MQPLTVLQAWSRLTFLLTSMLRCFISTWLPCIPAATATKVQYSSDRLNNRSSPDWQAYRYSKGFSQYS